MHSIHQQVWGTRERLSGRAVRGVPNFFPLLSLELLQHPGFPGGRLEVGKIETQARFFFSPKAAGKGLENCSLEANLIIGYQYYRVSTSEPHLSL